MLPVVPLDLGALPGTGLQGLLDILLQGFVLTLRIGAFLLAAPFFGSRMVPLPVRIVFGVAIAAFVFAEAPVPPVEVLTTLSIVPIVAQELAIGLTAGLVLTIIFSAAAVAGDKIASTAGLSFAAQVDPTGSGQTPVVSQIFMLFLIVVFLALNGHLVAIGMILESYRTVPVGASVALWPLAQIGVDAMGTMFALAASIMLPVAAVLFLLNLVIGVVTKSAPQLNLFSFGFPITLMAAFLLLFLSVGSLAQAFSDLIRDALAILDTIFGGLGRG